jgi:hypothetical protein
MLPVEEWRLTDTRMGASTNSTTTNKAMLAGIRYHKRIYKILRLNAGLQWPGWQLMVEPWFKAVKSQRLCSPDTVLLNRERGEALVIEVKKNWRDGRDEKLLGLYLSVVRSAFGVDTRPLMVVGNVRGLAHKPLLSFADVMEAGWGWQWGRPTPTLLVP